MQWTLFSVMDDPFSNLQDIITRLGNPTSSGLVRNPKPVWYHYKLQAPELVAVATALLSIVPSEAAVERSFSIQDLEHSKRRNRLLDDNVEREMFIRFNTSALNKSASAAISYLA